MAGRNLSSDPNLGVFSADSIVKYYEDLSKLTACETTVFDKYVEGGSLLDLGVGAGRTTSLLSTMADHYIGLDYSVPMIDACKKRFPDLRFAHGDAANLCDFPDGEFNHVIFSFNGIDCLPNDDLRNNCLREVARVLKPGGLFIFSVHNSGLLMILPQLAGAAPSRKLWRLLRSVIRSVQLSLQTLSRRSFWAGHGYINDPHHGGMYLHTATPGFVVEETSKQGFRIVEVVNGNFPAASRAFTTPWYYFVFERT